MDEICRGFSKIRSRFLAGGYHGTTMRMLAKELGIGERELYSKYGGKNTLVQRAIEYETDVLGKLLRAAEERSPAEPKKTMVTFLDSIYEYQTAAGVPEGLLIAEFSRDFPADSKERRSSIARAHDHLIKALLPTLEKLKDRNSSHDARDIAVFVLAALLGSSLLARADRDHWELKCGLAMLKEYLDSV